MLILLGGPINLNAEPNIYIYPYICIFYSTTTISCLNLNADADFTKKHTKIISPYLVALLLTHTYLGHLLIRHTIQFHHHRQRTKISFLAVYTMTILHLYLLLVLLFLMQQNVMSNTESEECNEKHNIADMPIFMIPSMAGTFFFSKNSFAP
jgi:hypothetical protein